MLSVTDRKKACILPSATVIKQSKLNLIGSATEAEYSSYHRGRCANVTVKDAMGIAVCHPNGIRVKVETRSITRLAVGGIVRDVNDVGIIDNRLEPAGPHKGRG